MLMLKSEEYQLKFMKGADKTGPFYWIDNSEAPEQYKTLNALSAFNDSGLEFLIKTITALQNSEPYDTHFWDMYEDFEIVEMGFVSPYIYLEGERSIHINDFKLLLIEWLEFKNLPTESNIEIWLRKMFRLFKR